MSLKQELMQFTGTMQYHKITSFSKLVVTDGILYLCEKAKCYWLIDVVVSVQHLRKVNEHKEFLIWKIYKSKTGGKGCRVDAYWDSEEDGTFSVGKLIYSQKIGYTTFPFDELGEFEFYQENDVLLLKGEH